MVHIMNRIVLLVLHIILFSSALINDKQKTNDFGKHIAVSVLCAHVFMYLYIHRKQFQFTIMHLYGL